MDKIEKAKNYLERYAYARLKIIVLDAGINDKCNMIKLIGNVGDIAKQLNEEIAIDKQAIKRWEQLQSEVIIFIDRLPLDKSLKHLLKLKYIQNKMFKEIASELNYSYDYLVRRLHKKALTIVAENL